MYNKRKLFLLRRTIMDRVAIIDLGSNSIRFIIMQIAENGAYKLMYQEKKTLRLSEGMTKKSPHLTEEAQKRALDCLSVYAHAAKVLSVTRIRAVATAAVRNAKNGSDFLRLVLEKTGIPMTVISGRKEAALGFSGVIHTIDQNDFLLFDLGGASVEISLVQNKERLHSVSIPIGAVTLTETFGSRDFVSPEKRAQISAFIRKKLAAVPWFPKKSIPVIGVGGTVRNLAKMHQRRTGYPLPKLHNYSLPTTDLYPMTDELCEKTLAERKRISGLSSERADIIIAGALVVSAITQMASAETLTVSGCGIREGLFFYDYEKQYGALPVKNMLRASAENYYHTLPTDDEAHVAYMTSMALTLFDGWRGFHGLSPRDRDLLLATGILHDIGMLVNYYSHARHSGYMIVNAHLFGLTHREQCICALAAACHRGNPGKILRTNAILRLMTEDDVLRAKKIAALLSIAEALDETEEQSITRLVCHVTPGTAELRVFLNAETCEVQRHATAPLLRNFAKLFKKPLQIQWFPKSTKPSSFATNFEKLK